jgi:hypothetical protein
MLGDVFVDHFGGTREHEVKLWNEAVTNWEGMSWACCATDSSDFDVHVVERYIELA